MKSTHYANVVILMGALVIVGCDDLKREMRGIGQIAAEMAKSEDQKAAEALCFQAAANGESTRVADFRAIANGSAETTSLGNSHYLIEIGYKVVTVSDPAEWSENFCLRQRANCEVQGGKLISARSKLNPCDSIRNQMQH